MKRDVKNKIKFWNLIKLNKLSNTNKNTKFSRQFASAVANKERNSATYTSSPKAINSKLQINL